MIVKCPECGKENVIDKPPQPDMRYRCGKCNTVLTFPQTPDIPGEMAKAVDKETSDEPGSATEPTDTGREVSVLKSTLVQSPRNGEDVKEELSPTSNVPAELQGQVKASPAIIQGEQILGALEELKSRLDRLVDRGTSDESGSVTEPSDTGREVSVLKSTLLQLQRNGEDVKEELSRTSNVLAELQGQVKASPAITQGEQILETLAELKSRLDKLEEEARVEAQEKVKKKNGGTTRKAFLIVLVVVIAIIVFMYYFGYIG